MSLAFYVSLFYILLISIHTSASFPHGSLRVDDGNMTHFVADNLEYKIKAASPKDGKPFEITHYRITTLL